MVQKDLDVAEYTDPDHNPMIHIRSSLSPVWRFTRSTGLLVLSRPTLEELRQDLRAVIKKCGRIGTLRRKKMKRRGSRDEKNSSTRTEKRTPKHRGTGVSAWRPFNTKADSRSGLPDAKRRQFLVRTGSTVAEGRDTES